ncbi:MAG: TIGR02530 family flagellar biosynthesis protein [Desulfotomaculaceae bacterium]
MVDRINSANLNQGEHPRSSRAATRPGVPGSAAQPGTATRPGAPGSTAQPGVPGTTFKEALQNEAMGHQSPGIAEAEHMPEGGLEKQTESPRNVKVGVKFSAHAERRLKERNIELGVPDLLEIDKALRQAAAKGSRESLLVYGDIALVTSVRNKTVVTAMEKEEASGRIFTNIDSTVLIDKKQ